MEMRWQAIEYLGRQVIDHEPVVVGEELHPHLGDFPAGDVVVETVQECHILTDHLRHRKEKVRGANHHFDRLVRVTEHRN